MFQTPSIAVVRRRHAVPGPVECEVDALYERLTRAYRSLEADSAAAPFAAERDIDLGIHFLVGARGVQNGVVFDVGTFFLTGRGRDDVSRGPMKMGPFLAVCRRREDGRQRFVRLSTAPPRRAARPALH